ncbi:MAG: F0F1 ATP synthase subunit epsilon [Gemmatimonadetes bacterium]|nr:F0F1 ATP synthase subunit epsilon [Gemmatimonadota bacterium]
MAGTFHVRVVSPEKVVYEGDASAMVAPAWDGRVGILPGHAPLLSLLGAGELAVEIPGGGTSRYYVAGGVLKVEAGAATVLTEYAGVQPPAAMPAGAVVQPEDVAEAASRDHF